MRIAYLDCNSGISGDMTLAALIDAGADLPTIQRGVASLGLPECHLVTDQVQRHGFRALNLQVKHPPEHAHRHLSDITRMIAGSCLSVRQQELAVKIFTRLAEAEAKVHGSTIEKVHFHEVGAVDSLADIVGTAIGWDLLGIERAVGSPVPTGGGQITIAHGLVGVPAPATAELLKGVPLAPSEVEAELTTPTGAAILSALVDQYGPLPAMSIESIGYGAGDREFPQQANLLRLLVGQAPTETGALQEQTTAETIWVLETHLDDVTAETIAYMNELLAEAGALDVSTTPIGMKKGRPGTRVTVLCPDSLWQTCEAILFRQSGTLGVRRWQAERTILSRMMLSVETDWGTVRGKLAMLPEGSPLFSAEYEDCRRLAQERGVALREIEEAARQAYRAQHADNES